MSAGNGYVHGVECDCGNCAQDRMASAHLVELHSPYVEHWPDEPSYIVGGEGFKPTDPTESEEVNEAAGMYHN